jgi:hypothetical protein
MSPTPKILQMLACCTLLDTPQTKSPKHRGCLSRRDAAREIGMHLGVNYRIILHPVKASKAVVPSPLLRLPDTLLDYPIAARCRSLQKWGHPRGG